MSKLIVLSVLCALVLASVADAGIFRRLRERGGIFRGERTGLLGGGGCRACQR